MRAFLLDIDDWLSSQQIRQMDPHEEMGYFRLLLAEASDERCSLPTDEKQLAILSNLGPQWFKPTRDRSKRIEGLTSGQKIMQNFTERDGSLFNGRLLREWNAYQKILEKRRYASSISAAVRAEPQNPYDEHMDSTCLPNVCANGSQLTSSSSSIVNTSKDWDASESMILNKFPNTDRPMLNAIIDCGVQAHVGATQNGTVLTDVILAASIKKATAKNQWSAALYLRTLPIVIANEVRSHERGHPK